LACCDRARSRKGDYARSDDKMEVESRRKIRRYTAKLC
jgi:hypothetical protein